MNNLNSKSSSLICRLICTPSLSRNGSSLVNDKIRVEAPSSKKMFVCLHPEPKFPYEHSKPIVKMSKPSVDSVLRVQHEQTSLRPEKDYTDEELMQLTYTSKEFWRPTNEWKKKMNQPKPARDGL